MIEGGNWKVLLTERGGGDVKKCIFQLKKHFNMFNFELSLKSNFVCEVNWLIIGLSVIFGLKLIIKKKEDLSSV